MDSTASGPIKPRLLALVAQGRAEQQAFITGLTEEERAAVGTPERWSAKDHLAHNAAWKIDSARLIATTVSGEVYAGESSTTFNPRVFAERQHQSWDAILAHIEQAGEALRTSLEGCSEEELSDPERFPWRGRYPLWTRAFVSGYEHPAEHYAQFYLEWGNVERARAIRESALETARRHIGDKEEFGYMVYNLGCFYALIQQPAPAIAAIRESFTYLPEMRGEVAEDPELAPLRDDPTFQAFVAELRDEGASS
jgi:tetratricopeptide (TPR) repeat protein